MKIHQLYLVHSINLRPNIVLQRTPLARPLRWARFLGVVACQRSCRSLEIASGAAEGWRSAATNIVRLHAFLTKYAIIQVGVKSRLYV